MTTCLASRVYLLTAAQDYLELLPRGAAVCQSLARAGWDAGTQRPVWQRPSLLLPLGGTAHPFSCCHDKHLPGPCTLAVIPHSICKSTQRWECHPGAFPGHFVRVPRAEQGMGWCWTGLSGVKMMLYRHGLKKKRNLAPFQSSKKYLSLWALIQSHL